MFQKKLLETSAVFEAKEEKLPPIRDFVEKFCQSSGVQTKEIPKILLAIEEVCSNVIRHAYLLGPGEIKLKIAKAKDRIS